MSTRLAVLALILGACGGSNPGGDAGPTPTDAFSCTSCVAPTAMCNTGEHRCDQCAASPDCADLPFTDVCVEGACRECAGPADCTSTSFGPTCDLDTGYCRCAAVGDCAGNANGTVCDLTLGACTCTGDNDCATPATCQLQPYLGPGAKTCQ